MVYTFKVKGKIRGKARPRFCVRNNRAIAYTTKEDKIYEDLIKECYLSQDLKYLGDNTYIKVDVKMFFAIPKSYTKKRKELCLKNIERPAKKPDVDNILKSILDSLQGGTAFKDDTQVISVNCEKFYTDEQEDFLIISLEEIQKY